MKKWIASGFLMKEDGYRVEMYESFKKSDISGFCEYIAELGEDIDSLTIVEFNKWAYKFYENDELDGFLQVFATKKEAEDYLKQMHKTADEARDLEAELIIDNILESAKWISTRQNGGENCL